MRDSARSYRRLALAALAVVGIGLTLLAIDRMIGNVPIRFFGRVTDQTGNGLGGVRVFAKVSLASWDGTPITPRYSESSMSAVSDAEGWFELRAWRGRRLDILRFEKPGWKLVAIPLVGVPTNFNYPARNGARRA
jgi:hypothetical protein